MKATITALTILYNENMYIMYSYIYIYDTYINTHVI